MSTICVYCGSNTGRDPRFRVTAAELGQAIADAGHGLVYGGGRVGLMGVVADAAIAAGGRVTGVMTEQLVDSEIAHGGLTELVVAASMHERKARMAALADGVIVLPGGYGTYEEAFEILTWNQLGLVATPVVFLDVAGFYAPLFDFLAGAIRSGFMHDGHAALAQRVSEPDAAVRAAVAPAPPFAPKWIDG